MPTRTVGLHRRAVQASARIAVRDSAVDAPVSGTTKNRPEALIYPVILGCPRTAGGVYPTIHSNPCMATTQQNPIFKLSPKAASNVSRHSVAKARLRWPHTCAGLAPMMGEDTFMVGHAAGGARLARLRPWL